MELIPEQIAQILRKSIVRGELQPGRQLDPASLAIEIKAAHAHVCQGLRQLAEEGFIVYEDSIPVVADLNETFELRLLLEPEALRSAIPNHSESLWEQAHRLLDEIASLEPDTPYPGFNWRFHKLLYSPSNRPRLLNIIGMLHSTSDELAKQVMEFREDSQEEHRGILNACERRSAEQACNLLIEHINNRRRELFNALSK